MFCLNHLSSFDACSISSLRSSEKNYSLRQDTQQQQEVLPAFFWPTQQLLSALLHDPKVGDGSGIWGSWSLLLFFLSVTLDKRFLLRKKKSRCFRVEEPV